MSRSHTNVLVIGGGPAGSTAATLLAREGLAVTLFEKDSFPRYHIGESGILPLPTILRLLGVEDAVRRTGCKRKGGVFFDWHEKWVINWGAAGKYTYHVDRAVFDQVLLAQARASGVTVCEPVGVEAIEFESGRPVRAHYKDGTGRTNDISFDFLVDASGRAGVLATRYLKSRRYLDAFRNVAVWGYWDGVKDPNDLAGFVDADRSSGPEYVSAPITVGAVDDGWIWGIPMPDNTMSVGLVNLKTRFEAKKGRGSTSAEIYHEAIAESESFRELLSGASLVTELRHESDWSYVTEQWAGPGYFLVGDAAAFIDPLLSTGMTTGMLSAVSAAGCIASIVHDGFDESDAYRFYGDDYRKRFWRTAFVVAALYAAKVPKEELFYRAHVLTSGDIDADSLDDLKNSFGRVISGLEDMREIGAAELQAIAGERLRENFPQYAGTLPLSSRSSANGVELVMEPRVRIRRAASAIDRYSDVRDDGAQHDAA